MKMGNIKIVINFPFVTEINAALELTIDWEAQQLICGPHELTREQGDFYNGPNQWLIIISIVYYLWSIGN